MGREIERKFILKHLPERIGMIKLEIWQDYIDYDKSVDKPIRLRFVRRQRHREYWLATKVGSGISRYELETHLTQQAWSILRALAPHGLKKIRYIHADYVPEGTLHYAYDLYQGELAGLQIAEVEFPNLEAAKNFRPPNYFGEEVTDNPLYSNHLLAITQVNPELLTRCTRCVQEGI